MQTTAPVNTTTEHLQDERKARILICVLYYLPHRTGMQLYIERIAQELVQRGHEVTVLAALHRPELPREETINGVRVIRVWAPPIPISRGMLMPAYPQVAYRLIKAHDVVHVHTPMLETALLGMLAKMANRKIVLTHHGDLILPPGIINRFIQGTMFMLYKFLAKRADRIVAYTADYADNSYYLQPFRERVEVIHPPITMPEPDMEHAAKLRAQWSHNGGPVIGYAGRFVQEKRPDLLIKALDTINQKYPDARIVFAGEYDIPYENTWELYKSIVDQYQDQLIFLGLMKDMQFMADFFAACDVLALTSDSECFALVQVEAMLSGTPVVMTNTPGGRVPVQLTGMGELSNPGDAAAIGEAITRVLGNPSQYNHARSDIENCFSFKETVDRYEAIFQELGVYG